MKRFFTISLLTAAVLMAGCSKDNETSDKGKTPETPETPETPTYPTEASVSLPSDGPLSVYSWTEADKIRIGDKTFSLSSGAGSKQAVFKGEAVEDKFYTIIWPSTLTGLQNYMDRNFLGQTQDGNGSTAHLRNTVLIEDVTSYGQMTFSKAWAESNGGSFRSNGVLELELTLPSDAGALESIIIESAGTKFPTNNGGDASADLLQLNLSNVTAGSAPVKAYLSLSEAALSIPAETGIKITVKGEKTCSISLAQAVEMGGGILTQIKVSDASAWTTFSEVNGDGSEASPYILKNAEDIAQMPELLKKGELVWFEMAADIDMKDVLNWVPLNTESPYDLKVHFDGKGHTISNFSVADQAYTSFFGVLNGYLGNVTFSKCSSKHTKAESNGSMGIIGGYAGASTGDSATVENVQVLESEISSAATPDGYFPLGGLFGTIVNTSIKNCSFDGSIQNNVYGVGNNPDRSATGGIAGKVNGNCSIENCTVSGTITTDRSRYTGGICGWVSPSEEISIKGCTNNATVTGGADRAAGIAGHFQQGTIENCINKGDISCQVSGSVSGAGGIVGYTGPAVIINCHNEGSVTGTGNAVGGIMGYAELASSIERCYSTGTISGGGRYVGGIAGGMKVADSSIKNCWSSGKVESTKNQEAAGILGSMMTGQTVSCCYSTAEIVAQRVAGGIVGRAANNSWTYTAKHANTVEKCIAWNPSVTATSEGDVDSAGGSGAIVGFTSFYNTLNSCWRNPDMEFSASDKTNNVLCDQPDCSESDPFVMGTTPGLAGKYGCPYHGKAATATATVSSLATSLGWDSSIWDLSADLPTLK